jgi:UDP:flavonoid glycosyltransferase YjiC (YdhE family)
VHFDKPFFAVPEQAFEQRLNGYMIERMGVGMRGDLARLTPSDIDRFLGNEDYYRSNMRAHARDGRAEAIETLHRFIGELSRSPAGARKAASRRKRVAVGDGLRA